MFAAKNHPAASTVVQKTWLSNPETTCCQRSPLSATALMPCGIGRPTWAEQRFFCAPKKTQHTQNSHNHGSGKLPQMKGNYYWRESFFTEAWLWEEGQTHQKWGWKTCLGSICETLRYTGTPRKSNDIKHDKPYERAHKNHSSPPSEVHVRNFHDGSEIRVS